MSRVNHLYLSVRFRQNPAAYDPTCTVGADTDSLLRDMALKYVQKLSEAGLVKMADDGFCLEKTQAGEIASRHYIRVDTMTNFLGLTAAAGESEIIGCLSLSAEYEQYHVKNNEKVRAHPTLLC